MSYHERMKDRMRWIHVSRWKQANQNRRCLIVYQNSQHLLLLVENESGYRIHIEKRSLQARPRSTTTNEDHCSVLLFRPLETAIAS
ncbi:hypothetical protein TNCV_2167141 [Trichonephila clavipes]|nr:hypothetical protein TNCV_2167141 [Trichonephila clavipes]